MHKIEVVVQPECLGEVSEALRRAKSGPFVASDVTIFDPSDAPSGSYRGASYTIGRERVKLELIVGDHDVEPTVEAIRKGVGTYGRGGMELIVLPVERLVH